MSVFLALACITRIIQAKNGKSGKCWLGGYDMDSGSSPKNNFFKIKSNLEEKGDNYDYLLATNWRTVQKN